MKYLTQFKLDDDSPVFIEIDDKEEAYGQRRVSRGNDGDISGRYLIRVPYSCEVTLLQYLN